MTMYEVSVTRRSMRTYDDNKSYEHFETIVLKFNSLDKIQERIHLMMMGGDGITVEVKIAGGDA